MARAFTPVLGAAWVLAACSSAEVRRVEIGGLGVEVARLIVTDEDFVPLRVGAPDASIEEDERVLVLGVNREMLSRVEPALTRAVIESFALDVSAPPPSLIRSPSGAHQRASFQLPPEVVLVDVDLSPAPRGVLAGLTGSLVVPGEDDGGLALRPFGDRASLVPVGTRVPGEGPSTQNVTELRRVVPLSEDRVLVMSERFMAVVDRGRPLTISESDDGASPFMRADRLGREPYEHLLRSVVVDDDGSRGWAVGELRSRPGAIWTFEVSAAGLRPTGTATIAPHPAWAIMPELVSVAMDARRNVIVGGGNAIVLVRARDRDSFEARPRLLTLHKEWVTRETGYLADITTIAPSGDRTRPQLLGTQSGRLIAGDAVTDEWELATDVSVFERGSLGEPHITAVAIDPVVGEVWAGSRGGGLVRRSSARAPWAPVRVGIPPSLEVCATQDVDGGFWFPRITGLAIDATHVYVAIDDCSSVLRVRRDDGSTSAIHRVGEAARRETETSFFAIVLGARGPIAVGGGGSVYEISR